MRCDIRQPVRISLVLFTLLVLFPTTYSGIGIAKADSVIATIPVGADPREIAVNPYNGDVYVANGASSTVSVISESANKVISTIPVGSEPRYLAVNPSSGNVYVSGPSSTTVSVISPRNQVIATIPLGSFSSGIAFNPFNGNAYVSNKLHTAPATSVSVISGSTNRVIATSTIPPVPPDTTISSAIDGNGATVPNGGTSVSSSIRIIFSAMPGTNRIDGFECSLDNSAFSLCSSPTSITNLIAGKHVFQVRAIETLGNRNPTPATFTWTILTPSQAIQQLIQLKHSMQVAPTTDQALDSLLNGALQFSQKNNDRGTCLHLGVFLRLVQGELLGSDLSSVQAAHLIQSAQNIQKALGCI